MRDAETYITRFMHNWSYALRRLFILQLSQILSCLYNLPAVLPLLATLFFFIPLNYAPLPGPRMPNRLHVPSVFIAVITGLSMPAGSVSYGIVFMGFLRARFFAGLCQFTHQIIGIPGIFSLFGFWFCNNIDVKSKANSINAIRIYYFRLLSSAPLPPLSQLALTLPPLTFSSRAWFWCYLLQYFILDDGVVAVVVEVKVHPLIHSTSIEPHPHRLATNFSRSRL